MAEYIVFWKDAPGQQVSTVIDANQEPVRRDEDYVHVNDIEVLDNDEQVIVALSEADGKKYAVEPQVARRVLGWDV